MKKRACSLLAVFLACVMITEPVYAKTAAQIQQEKEQKKAEASQNQSKLDEINSQLNDLKGEQEDIQTEIDELDSQLVEIMASVSLKEEEIAAVEEQIVQAQKDYEEAKQQEEDQYEAMKERIRFIYEKGDTTYLELFLESSSFKDMLNKAEYVEKLYEYDRKMLNKYVETKEQVAEKQNQLEDSKSELEAEEHELQEEKSELQSLLDDKKEASADYDSQIARISQEAAVYKEQIQKQNEEIRKLEAEEAAKIKEEEEARKKAEEAKKKTESSGAAASSQTASGSSSSSSSSSGSSSGGAKTVPPKIGTGTGSDIAQYACLFVGNPYVPGGTSLTNGADCSGFTQSVYRQYGYSIPRTSAAQRSAGREVSYEEAQPGDLICYAGHVAIYLGGGRIVHASSVRTGIKYGYATYKPILSVRRIVN